MLNSYVFLNMLIITGIMLIIPLITIIILGTIIDKWFRTKYEDKIKYYISSYWFYFGISVVFFLLALLFRSSFSQLKSYVLSQAELPNISMVKYLFHFNPLIWGVVALMLGAMQMYIKDMRPERGNQELIKRMERKNNRLDDPSNIDLNYKRNILIIGKTGAGKTVAISNFIKERIKNGQFCLLMDGKGEIGNYSLFDTVRQLCEKYNRKLYVINQTIPNETDSYNPFKGCNATQIKDMLLNMSNWTEEHYKLLNGEYYQAIAEFIIKYKVFNTSVTFNTLAKYCDPNYFASVLDKYKEFVSEDDYLYYQSVINTNGEVASQSRSRFTTVARGIGRQLFDDSKPMFNIQTAFDEKAVVFVLLNKLEYTDFAESVGKLVLNDIKNLLGKITKIKDYHEDFVCVYDELSSYFDELLVDIVNKSRSLGGCNIIATQTISDMDILSEDIRRQIIGNIHAFYILKQNDDLSAEAIASVIGTKKKTEHTSKTDQFGKTGIGTSRIVDEFVIHPNTIKNLPLEVGIWVDTMKNPLRPYRLKLPYVQIEEE